MPAKSEKSQAVGVLEFGRMAWDAAIDAAARIVHEGDWTEGGDAIAEAILKLKSGTDAQS